MATTTNFGWETPDDTDLVKDGAAAMRTLGNSIDTSFVDLKGGTTGQILSKASNTDLDYTWISPNPGDITGVTAGTGISGGGTSGDVTITNSMATAIDAKGDLIAGTGADAFSRLAVGANNTVLTADSTTATGLKWASPTSTQSYTLINSPSGTSLTGATTVNVSLSGSYNFLIIRIDGCSSANANSIFTVEPNASSLNCRYVTTYYQFNATGFTTDSATNQGLPIAKQGSNATDTITAYAFMSGISGTGLKSFNSNSYTSGTGLTYLTSGVQTEAAALTSIQIKSSTGNFDAGTMFIYGAN